MDVEHSAGEDRKRGTRECDGWDDDADDEKMTQQSREGADVAAIEDPSLVDDDCRWVSETEPDGIPVSGLETGDEEVIEVDENADCSAVDDEGDGGNGVAGNGNGWENGNENAGDNEREKGVMFRVDERSPIGSTAAGQ